MHFQAPELLCGTYGVVSRRCHKLSVVRRPGNLVDEAAVSVRNGLLSAHSPFTACVCVENPVANGTV